MAGTGALEVEKGFVWLAPWLAQSSHHLLATCVQLENIDANPTMRKGNFCSRSLDVLPSLQGTRCFNASSLESIRVDCALLPLRCSLPD